TAIDSHVNFPYDYSAYEKTTALAVFGGKLYAGVRDTGTGVSHIISWDGVRGTISTTDEETFAAS
ncbi:unnamed protein product, partial [marine sediment metagenome]